MEEWLTLHPKGAVEASSQLHQCANGVYAKMIQSSHMMPEDTIDTGSHCFRTGPDRRLADRGDAIRVSCIRAIESK